MTVFVCWIRRDVFVQTAELFGVIFSLWREFNSRGDRVNGDHILVSGRSGSGLVFQVILNVTRRVVLVEFFVLSVSPCFRLRPMRCATRRGKDRYGSYDNDSLLASRLSLYGEPRENALQSPLATALAWLLAIPPNEELARIYDNDDDLLV